MTTDPYNILPRIVSIKKSKDTEENIPNNIIGFRHPTIYPGQSKAIDQIKSSKECIITSHTGSGKTDVFLAATYGHTTLIIEPRRFLQIQVFDAIVGDNKSVIYGKSHYKCKYGDSAAVAPCVRTFTKTKKLYNGETIDIVYFKSYNEITGKFDEYEYPCYGCEYKKAKDHANATLAMKGTVVCNHGNFREFYRKAEIIVVDEADLVFGEISSSRKMLFVVDCYKTAKETLEKEHEFTLKEIQDLKKILPNDTKEDKDIRKKIHDFSTHSMGVKNLIDGGNICYQYKDKHNDIHAEIKPNEKNALKKIIFKQNNTILVTATPREFDVKPIIDYSVFQRTGIFYTPVAKITQQTEKTDPLLYKKCADYIISAHKMFKDYFPEHSNKCIIHCSSFKRVMIMQQYLGLKNCDIHTSKHLKEAVESFKLSPSEYLLVAGAEYGADFPYINHQFILKVPYPGNPTDPKMLAYKKEVGISEFNDWYNFTALTKIIQQCGRVGRGKGGFGCTFILDEKFIDLYYDYSEVLPQWFKNKLIL